MKYIEYTVFHKDTSPTLARHPVNNPVMERLLTYSPGGQVEDRGRPMIAPSIIGLQEKGWTDDEIVSKLRWLEHVNPTIAEDVALRNMKLADERVAARMATTKS